MKVEYSRQLAQHLQNAVIILGSSNCSGMPPPIRHRLSMIHVHSEYCYDQSASTLTAEEYGC